MKKHCLQQARPPSLHAAARSSQLPDARSLHPLVIAPAAAPDFPATPVLCSLAWPLINAGSAPSSCPCAPLRFPLSADPPLVPYRPLTSPYRLVAHQAGKRLPIMLTSTPVLPFSQQTQRQCLHGIYCWECNEGNRLQPTHQWALGGTHWRPKITRVCSSWLCVCCEASREANEQDMAQNACRPCRHDAMTALAAAAGRPALHHGRLWSVPHPSPLETCLAVVQLSTPGSGRSAFGLRPRPRPTPRSPRPTPRSLTGPITVGAAI